MTWKHIMHLRDLELSFYDTFLEYSRNHVEWNAKFFERLGL